MGFRTRAAPPASHHHHHHHHHLFCSRSSSSPRLKREDHSLLPHHDSLFSEWKILVGPTDWEKYFSGTEGSARYRSHNVKGAPFSPGVYELALCSRECANANGTRSTTLRSKKETLVVVYVGQAENLYYRLQEYGRTGSHLEAGGGGDSHKCGTLSTSNKRISNTSACKEMACDCPRLFTKAFLNGYPIAFRWTPTKSRADAMTIEAGLLKCFDYAWNRGSNGDRRPNDTFLKLQQKTEKLKMKSVIKALSRKLWEPNKSSKGMLSDEGNQRYKELDTLPWTCHAMKETVAYTLESLKSESPHEIESTSSATYKTSNGAKIVIAAFSWESPQKGGICGVTYANGMICKHAPLYGRKRCALHKGMRIPSALPVPCKQGTQEENSHFKQMVSEDRQQSQNHLIICGVLDANGIVCNKAPEYGRKRCNNHRGMRMMCPRQNNTCGVVDVSTGLPCKERPLSGRKRCDAHKGMRLL